MKNLMKLDLLRKELKQELKYAEARHPRQIMFGRAPLDAIEEKLCKLRIAEIQSKRYPFIGTGCAGGNKPMEYHSIVIAIMAICVRYYLAQKFEWIKQLYSWRRRWFKAFFVEKKKDNVEGK